MDLVTFAAKLKPACFVCGIPERAEIEAAWAKGIRTAAITAWLIDVKGYDADTVPERKKIERHFEGNHTKRAGQ